MPHEFMIYGANGYTGQLVAEEAVRRGHRPTLAGRNETKLRPLAERLGLPYRIVDLADPAALRTALASVPLVFHAAGPFVHTCDAMLRACLDTRTSYVDITGEIPAFQKVFGYAEAAQNASVALVPGVGFDVVPTDCLASYVAAQLPSASHLDIAIAGMNGLSAGTAKSMVEGAAVGGLARRDGALVSLPFGAGGRQQRFSKRSFAVMPIPWGDLETAYRATGIPNITTWMSFPKGMVRAATAFSRLSALTQPITRALLQQDSLKGAINRAIDARVVGPDDAARARGRSYVWACARNGAGEQREAWLESIEPYAFTAVAGVRAVERLLAQALKGAFTPAQAFGADFVLGIEGTQRFDSL